MCNNVVTSSNSLSICPRIEAQFASFTTMPSSDEIFADWQGIIDNEFFRTIRQTFEIPENDSYTYRAESFAMTLSVIEQEQQLKYKYHAHGQAIEVCDSSCSDIN